MRVGEQIEGIVYAWQRLYLIDRHCSAAHQGEVATAPSGSPMHWLNADTAMRRHCAQPVVCNQTMLNRGDAHARGQAAL